MLNLDDNVFLYIKKEKYTGIEDYFQQNPTLDRFCQTVLKVSVTLFLTIVIELTLNYYP